MGSAFSAKISSVISAIAATLAIPSGKRITNSSQQQPRQYTPCSRPMRNAPPRPSRHELMMKLSGVRHFERQTSLSGESW